MLSSTQCFRELCEVWLCHLLLLRQLMRVRRYLQRQFCAWIGSIPAGVLLSAAVFGAGHIYQGGKPAIVIAVYGVLFGILAEMRKSLRPGMMAHAWHDTIIGLLAGLIQR